MILTHWLAWDVDEYHRAGRVSPVGSETPWVRAWSKNNCSLCRYGVSEAEGELCLLPYPQASGRVCKLLNLIAIGVWPPSISWELERVNGYINIGFTVSGSYVTAALQPDSLRIWNTPHVFPTSDGHLGTRLIVGCITSSCSRLFIHTFKLVLYNPRHICLKARVLFVCLPSSVWKTQESSCRCWVPDTAVM